MGGQQKDFISDIVFFQHQDGMRLKVRRHFLQSILSAIRTQMNICYTRAYNSKRLKRAKESIPWNRFRHPM
jgi:hypothetical protein